MAVATGAGKENGIRTIPRMWDIFGKTSDDSTAVDDIADELPKKLRLNDCSSLCANGGNDSAISVGSTSDEDVYVNNSNSYANINTGTTKKKKHQRTSRKDVAVVADSEMKYLERHLSMKKTIRKKIMRDLQKAFVEDPNEFRVEDIPREQLKADINLQSLSFAHSGKKKGKKTNESNFLDFLRTGSGDTSKSLATSGCSQHHIHHYRNKSGKEEDRDDDDDDDSGHSSPARMNEYTATAPEPDEDRKTSFWRRFTIKGNRNRR